MTEDEAYAAMFQFIKKIYERTDSDELGGMLGSMSLLRDGQTADPAMMSDWKDAVAYALEHGKADLLELTPLESRKA
ncbi:hypothetical protein [Lichenifustis flavocetrariae]|uniref:Uncharacterized protein n=1 Tax=Lichenifustis flavocetrariae TaxID=2949735 RepID=A0AA41Z6I2_9HYPH|nr:hypothetical protein [Lichenifustis flavocetrariae]MCW6511408.1 hypothetical protein [Lichenifustis flavocetrariae]